MPTARAPLIRAIWPTTEPTAPEAAATTTASPTAHRQGKAATFLRIAGAVTLSALSHKRASRRASFDRPVAATICLDVGQASSFPYFAFIIMLVSILVWLCACTSARCVEIPRRWHDRVIDRSPIHFRSSGLPSTLCSRCFFQGAITFAFLPAA